MSVYKPSELQAFLEGLGVSAKKGFSQNFLIDGNIIRKISLLANVQAGDHIIEIGPGPGALTQELLRLGAHVTAIEMDKTFATALQRLQTPDQRLAVIEQDFLLFPLEQFFQKHPERRYKLVANLPYHITTPLLTLLLPQYPAIESLTVMVQKEFAVRMSGKTHTADFSSFTVFLEFYATVTESFNVSPNCFYPRPKVHSSVVHCLLHPPLLNQGIEQFFKMTRAAFGQRRKMIRTSLKELYPPEQIAIGLNELKKPITSRPEELSTRDWIALFRFFSLHGTKN